MTVVSSKEFVANEDKYFDMAVNGNVCIQRGENMFHIICSNFDTVKVREQKILQPDDDLHRAITMDELLERTYGVIDKFFADK
jgi:hypothetical protein